MDSAEYKGKIIFFNQRKGFGFIEPEGKVTFKGTHVNTDAEDSKDAEKPRGIFVGSARISSSSRRPWGLRNGTEVAFKVYKDDEGRYAAAQVTQPDGTPFAGKPKKTPEEKAKAKEESREKKTPKTEKPKRSREEKVVNPADEKCEVSKTDRYMGVCRIWSYKRQFGFIKPDKESVKFDGNDVDLSEGVFVHRTAIMSESSKGQILSTDQRVAFTLTHSDKGYSADQVTQETDFPVTFDLYKKAQSTYRKRLKEERAATKKAEAEAEPAEKAEAATPGADAEEAAETAE